MATKKSTKTAPSPAPASDAPKTQNKPQKTIYTDYASI